MCFIPVYPAFRPALFDIYSAHVFTPSLRLAIVLRFLYLKDRHGYLYNVEKGKGQPLAIRLIQQYLLAI